MAGKKEPSPQAAGRPGPVPSEEILQERFDLLCRGGGQLSGGDPAAYNYATGRRGGMAVPPKPHRIP